MTAVTTPGGETTRLFYEKRSRPKRIEYPDGRVQHYERNERDFITGLVENGVRVFQQELDSDGRVKRRETGDGDVYTFDYDAMGNLLGADTTHADDSGIRLEYDALGRIVAEAGVLGRQHYDYLHGREHVTARWSEALELDFQWKMTRDGPAWSVASDDQWAVQIDYDHRMRTTGTAFGNGERHRFNYDEKDSPSVREIIDASGHTTDERYEYDEQGWLSASKDSPGRASRYTRDPLNRLIGVSDGTDGRNEERTWSFDERGNRMPGIAGSQRSGGTAYARGNRVVAVGGRPVAYDNRGRVVALPSDEDGAMTMDWDCLGRLRKVSLPDGRAVTMRYDATGRRIAKTTGTGHDAIRLVRRSTGP